MLSDPARAATEREACSADPVRWVNNWCWTYDPRAAVSTLPFDLFARQEEYLRWLQQQEQEQSEGLVEKCRDAGVTWLCCAYALHGWLFRPGYAVGFGSRKLDLVDQLGNPDCIFEKMRFLLGMLPAWMLPAGFEPRRHSGWCKLLNPQTGASITGEGGDQIGRGGRKSLYFVDESAFLERPRLVERSLSQTTRVRIDVSTPNGPGTVFAQRRFSGKVPVFVFDWRDDPRKDEAWFAGMKATLDPVTLAQEISRDHSASVEGIVIPAAWVRAAIGLKLPMGGHNVGGLDVAEMGRDKSVLVARCGPVVFTPLSWGQTNTTETAHRATEHAAAQEVRTLYYDVTGVGAGVRGTWEAVRAEKPLGFQAVAVNAGESPSETRWPGAGGKSSKELFTNKRAELWWLLRARFERTWEYVEKGVKHAPEDMISIPNHPDLVAELSLPTASRLENGKIKIESKEDMRRRGVRSPDHADALCLAFHPETGWSRGSWKMERI